MGEINYRDETMTLGGMETMLRASPIGTNVTIQTSSFDNDFANFYNSNGKKAGVYTYDDKKWNYKAQ